MQLDAATVTVAGEIRVINGAALGGVSLQTLALEADAVSVDASSSISVSLLGYYSSLGPVDDPDPSSRRACHGGNVGSATADCAYGDYRRARYPGRGGHNTRGGGVLEILADTLTGDTPLIC